MTVSRVALTCAAALCTGTAMATATPVTIPVHITEWPSGTPAPTTTITGEVDWVTPSGTLMKPVAGAPLVNGALQVDVPPIPAGLRWSVELWETGQPGPVYRSAPLARLPATNSRFPLFNQWIDVVRETFHSDALFSPDWQVASRIESSLAPYGPATVRLSASPGSQTWHVIVVGRGYRFGDDFALRPATDIAHPERVIQAVPQGPGVYIPTWPFGGPGATAVRTTVTTALSGILSAYPYFLPPPPFTPTSISVSSIGGFSSDGSLTLRANGGRIGSDLVVVGPPVGAAG
ncbi:MAG: hypothetical protein U0Y82_03620 [Thermoleophilia bacterium]